MKIRKIVLRALLVVVGAIVALIMIAIGWFYARFYTSPRATGTIVSSGVEGEYLLHVPPSYHGTRPVPLVISLHAAALWPASQMETSRWNRLADEHGFIVVYPSGTNLQGGGTGVRPKAWILTPEASAAANVAFISDLIDALGESYSIDPTRIYANGLSNGAAMAFVLSCRLADRIAAVGTVAAAQDLPSSWCADSPPVPLINFHGKADPIVPYEGGLFWASPRPFPEVRTWTADWARRNRCEPGPVEATVVSDVIRLEYSDCADDATVVLYTIDGAGHTWPGGAPMPEWLVGRTINSIDATRLMWEFFREYRLADSSRDRTATVQGTSHEPMNTGRDTGG